MAEEVEPRNFPLPIKSILMSEYRIAARMFDVNLEVAIADVVIAMAELPPPADPDNLTELEQMQRQRAMLVSLNTEARLAMLYLAVKRQIPTTSVADVEAKADSGEWILDLSGGDPDNPDAGPAATGDESDPLPPPAAA